MGTDSPVSGAILENLADAGCGEELTGRFVRLLEEALTRDYRERLVFPGTVRVGFYNQMEIIRFERFESFLKRYLPKTAEKCGEAF